MRLRSIVPADANGLQLPVYLARRFIYLTLEQWHVHIREHRLWINEQHGEVDSIVHTNDAVYYEPPPFTEPPADMNYSVVYEDEWLLGINKPGNLLVHRSGRSFKNNLMYALRNAAEGNEHFGLVNRLDRETSGVVLVAKDLETLRRIHHPKAWSKVEKKYLALVHNRLPQPVVTVDSPIGKDLESSVSVRHKAGMVNGKQAVTEFEELQTFVSNYSLIRATPRTGRTHQIRVHCAYLGVPIVSDKLYSLPEKTYLQWKESPSAINDLLLLKRQALHCSFVSFRHPRTGEQCDISAPLPQDMADLLETLS